MAEQKEVKKTRPKMLQFSERGIRTDADFANMMSALITDLAAGDISPQTGNAICNAGGKLLKVYEMKYRYGKEPGPSEPEKVLMLASGI